MYKHKDDEYPKTIVTFCWRYNDKLCNQLDHVPFNHMELPHDDYGWLFIYKIDYPYLPLSSWKRRKICGIFLVYLAIRHYFIIFVAEYAALNAVL